MQVSELLRRKGAFVSVIEPQAPVSRVVHELSHQKIGALVVSSDGKTIEGIISERDVVRAFDEVGAAILESPVSLIMSSQVRTCSPEDTVESLMATMTTHRIRHIPVVEDEELEGIVSIGDVVKTRMDELESDRDALMNYITAR